MMEPRPYMRAREPGGGRAHGVEDVASDSRAGLVPPCSADAGCVDDAAKAEGLGCDGKSTKTG